MRLKFVGLDVPLYRCQIIATYKHFSSKFEKKSVLEHIIVNVENNTGSFTLLHIVSLKRKIFICKF